MKITGLVLAGGKSSRMGRDKALLVKEGKTLLLAALEMVSKICDNTVIGSSDPHHSMPGVRRVMDRWPECGPMASIASAMEALPASELFLPVGVDQAGLFPGILSHLVNVYQSHAGSPVAWSRPDALAFQVRERIQPLGAVYHRRTLPVFRRSIQQGNLSLYRLFRSSPTFASISYEEAFPQFPDAFCNLNSPQDFIRFSQIPQNND